MIRVVVAEDSPTVRRLLVEMLNSDPAVRVVGEARSGDEAVAMAERLRPDLVTMDIEMPGLDGLAATREIMAATPLPILVVTALATQREGDLVFDATRAGALGVLPKPADPASPQFARQRDQLVAMAKAMAGVKVVRRRPTEDDGARSVRRPASPGTNGLRVATPPGGMAMPGLPALSTPARPLGRRASLVAIATSTGGPPALRDLLAGLPRDFPVPIVVVQHIARGFVGPLAHWLGGETRRPVLVAEEGMQTRPGSVYIAPDDRHLGVARAGTGIALTLADAPPVGGFRPSGSWLFESVAQALGGEVVAVILTGMGSDGVSGLRTVRAQGGRVIAQDEATSVVYGMPREAARAGLADVVLPLPEIAAQVAELVRGGA